MNGIPKELLLSVGGALLCAFAVSFLMCPLVKSFAYKIGAIDVPKDNRRMHKKPVPRLGGLAIFLGFIVSMLLFVKVDHQLQGILLGASIIVVLGVVDDMSPLRAYFKFCVQIFAALVAVFHGVVIQTLSNPNVFAESPYWDLGWLSIPITVLWIVGITNAVNLMKEHYADAEYNLERFVRDMGYSKTLVNKKMQDLTGQPIGQFMKNYRLNVAQRIIQEGSGDINVSEIAYAVGFNDPKYFTKCFKEFFGYLPSSKLGKKG